MQATQNWISDSLKKILSSLSTETTKQTISETEDIVNNIFKNHYEEKIYLENGNICRSNKSVRTILAIAFKKAKELNNNLIFTVTAQLLMKKQPGLLIDYKGMINNSGQIEKSKGLSIWIDNYILHEEEQSH